MNYYPFTVKQLITILDAGESFSHIKLCHGFWEREVRFYQCAEESGIKGELTDSLLEEVFDRVSEKIPTRWPFSMYLELRGFLSGPRDNVHIFVSEYGWHRGYEIEGTPEKGLTNVRQRISNYFNKTRLYNALFWKNSIIDGSFAQFLSYIRNRKVLIVGPKYLNSFSSFAGLEDSCYIEVDQHKAAWMRDNIFKKISAYIALKDNNRVICLMQAGGTTSAWLIYKLAKKFPNASFMNLGQALNICNFEQLENKNWFMVYRKQICNTIQLINNIVTSELERDENKPDKNEHKENVLNEIYFKGYQKSLFQQLNKKLSNLEQTKQSFASYKKIDHELVRKIFCLLPSKTDYCQVNPIISLLEESIHDFLDLKKNKRVVIFKSADDAISSIVALKQNNHKKKLRWAVPAFGFLYDRSSLFSDSLFIDNDKLGMLSLKKLEEFSLDEWDGLIVTTVFGNSHILNKYIEYCIHHDKELIIDNSYMLKTPSRNEFDFSSELINFHHSLPWGIDDGAAIIVDTKDTSFVNAININSEVIGKKNVSKIVKENISDYSAALILQRLINYPNWSSLYQLQKRRMRILLTGLGINVLDLTNDIVGYLPCIFPIELYDKDLSNDIIPLEKMHKPISDRYDNANILYSRLVNIPCHPDIANIETHLINQLFTQLIGKYK